MDETTSSVDKAADSMIQHAFRKELGESTLLVIAHRLSTVADSDKILVVGDEKCVEFGQPKELLRNKGEFWELVQHSGELEDVERMIVGKCRKMRMKIRNFCHNTKLSSDSHL